MISNELKAMAAAAALNKTLQSSFFSICSVNDAAKILNRNPHCEEYDFLRGLHCVDYSTMPRQLREQIPVLVSVCLGFDQVPDSFKPVEMNIQLLNTSKLDGRTPTMIERFKKAWSLA